MKPAIGRIVHYYDELLKEFAPRGVGPYAAIVTCVRSDTVVDVEVFPGRLFGEEVTGLELMGGDRGQTRWWQWPARVEEIPKPGAFDPDANVPSNENVV